MQSTSEDAMSWNGIDDTYVSTMAKQTQRPSTKSQPTSGKEHGQQLRDAHPSLSGPSPLQVCLSACLPYLCIYSLRPSDRVAPSCECSQALFILVILPSCRMSKTLSFLSSPSLLLLSVWNSPTLTFSVLWPTLPVPDSPCIHISMNNLPGPHGRCGDHGCCKMCLSCLSQYYFSFWVRCTGIVKTKNACLCAN